MSDKYNGTSVLVKRSAMVSLMVSSFMTANLVPLFPTSPQIRNQVSRMVVNLIPADLSQQPHDIPIVTKCDDPNILNISGQEILRPKYPVLRPGIAPVTSESMDKH